MELWSPPRDVPHLFEWWRPLVMASRRARAERLPWPIHVDEYRLSGRVVRRGRPDVWIYEHHANGGALCVDHTGSAYRFVATPGADDGAIGQFRACPLAESLRRAGIPQVAGRVTYHHPDPTPAADAESSTAAEEGPPAPPRPPIRRGHLTLVAGCA